jgi:O-antigen ligase
VSALTPRDAALALPTQPRALGATQRLLARLAVLGVFVHAAFLSISVAGMQIGLGLSAGALLLLRLTGRRVWARSAVDLPVLVLTGAVVASLGLGILAGSPPVGWHEATLWRSLLAPPVIVSVLELSRGEPGEDEDAPRRLALAVLAVWAAASLVPSAIAWVQYFTGLDPLHALGLRGEPVHSESIWFRGRWSATGFFRWYQRLAHNLTPPLCVAAAVALRGGVRGRLRLLLGGAALAASLAVVLTLSRAAYAALALAAVILALQSGRLRRWALPLALAASVAMALVPAMRVRLVQQGPMGDNADRKAIWKVCAAVVRDHPLTGVGWGNLPARAAPYYQRLAPQSLMRAWCHDSFFSAWAEGGPLYFLALVAYWALLARAFWRARRGDALAASAAVGGLAAVAAMLANSLAHDILYSSEATFGLGFAVAVAAALARPPRAEVRPEDAPAAGTAAR